MESTWWNMIDEALAEFILKKGSSQEALLLLSHLSKATRAGHLCISYDDGLITPSIEELWNTSEKPLTAEEMQNMQKQMLDGFKQLPEHPALRREGHRLYFQLYWNLEQRFIERYRSLRVTPPSIPIVAPERVENLLPEQLHVVKHVCENALTLLCGGPGTGKTYTAGQMIHHLRALIPRMALAAPTGKAAANLQKSLEKALSADVPKVQTLHALLYGKSSLPYDLILVDESSMIDVHLMVRLLESLTPGARLVLIGDPHQLPPVEAGGLFSDITRYEQSLPDSRVCTLNTCMRTDLQSIITFAKHILDGHAKDAWQMIRPILPSLEPMEAFVELVAPHFIPPKGILDQPSELLAFFNRFRILSPLRRGPAGVDSLNARLAQHLAKQRAIPILITKNDAKLNLFNGEMGVLLREENCALFEGRRISAVLLPPYEYAYCLSVHKSQGSEFDHVLLILTEGTEIFGREGLYTAVTRAKKQLDLICREETFLAAVSKQVRRQSGILELNTLLRTAGT